KPESPTPSDSPGTGIDHRSPGTADQLMTDPPGFAIGPPPSERANHEAVANHSQPLTHSCLPKERKGVGSLYVRLHHSLFFSGRPRGCSLARKLRPGPRTATQNNGRRKGVGSRFKRK